MTKDAKRTRKLPSWSDFGKFKFYINNIPHISEMLQLIHAGSMRKTDRGAILKFSERLPGL